MSDVGISKNGHSSPTVVASEAAVSSPTNSPNSEVAKNSSSTTTTPNNATENNRSAEYYKLIDYGLHEKVAARLEEIYKTGKVFCLLN